MTDEKIINWMLKGSVEINQVFRVLDLDLLTEILLPQYTLISKTILDYYSRHKIPPNYEVIKEVFSGDAVSVAIINNIEKADCRENEFGFHCDNVKQRYNKYLLDGFVKGYSNIEDLSSLNVDIKKIISKTERVYRNDVFSEGNLRDSISDRVNDYNHRSKNPDFSKGMMSGFRELDDYTWGIKKSEMLVIGGASSSGKSLLMMNMAINAWKGSNDPCSGVTGRTDGRNVLYISLEMSKPQLEQRVDANLAKIEHKNIQRGKLTDEEKKRWKGSLSFQKSYEKVFYILDMPRGSTMAEIEAKYETILGVFKPEAVFVDYLQLMSPSSGSIGSDWQDVGKVAEELHELCRKKDIPVITAAQRKAGMKKTAKQYKDNVDLEDLGRSKMIGDNATVVMLIANREDELLREDLELHIVKNRDGAKGKINLRKIFSQSRLEDLPVGWSADVGDENDI
jgi:replicative DNA helicase